LIHLYQEQRLQVCLLACLDEEAIAKKNGFYLQNLEAGITGEVFLKATKSSKIMNILNKAGLSKLIEFHSHKDITSFHLVLL